MSDSFRRIWDSPAFVPTSPADLVGPCSYAVAFQAWVDVLFRKQLSDATHLRLLQLQLQVTRKYFEWRTRLPDSHRHEDGREPDHVCVFSVFERAIAELSERELALAPPPLIQVVHPKVDPPETLVGVLFGDIDEVDG